MSRHELKYLFLIVLIFLAACIETDIYLPAFPDMMQFFAVNESRIQSLLSWNFWGICLSSPIYGPLSDAIGRKKPLIFALVIFAAGSLVTVWTDDFSLMLLGRVLQGIGSGGCFTLGTAVLFDAFREDRAVAIVGHLNTIVPVTMAAAPMIGGLLNYHFGFRANFVAIAILVITSLIICLATLEETLEPQRRFPLDPAKIGRDFARTLSSGPFWLLTSIICMLFAAYLSFVSISSVLFVLELGVAKAWFPVYQGSVIGSYVAGSLALARLTTQLGSRRVKRFGLGAIALGGVSFVVTSLLTPRDPILLTLTMCPFGFGCSLLMGPYFTEVMEMLPDIKGTVASLLTSLRLLITAALLGVVAQVYDGTVMPLTFLVGSALLIAGIGATVYERRYRR